MNSKEWKDKVASQGCILCHIQYGTYAPAELHHIGDTSERSDWLVIPLCSEHHRNGPQSRHGAGERAWNAIHRTSEIKLLAETLRRL